MLDTIAAISTPRGKGGVALIRISGHTQCGEIQAFQWRFDCRYVDTEGIFNAEPLFPWLFYRQVIDVVFVAVTGLGDSLQNTGGDAGMQVDQPAILKGTGAVDAAGNSLMNMLTWLRTQAQMQLSLA